MLRMFGSGLVLLLAIVVAATCAPARQGSAPAGTAPAVAQPAGARPSATVAAEPVPPPKAPGEASFEVDEATLTQQANAALAGVQVGDTPLGSATVKDLAVQLRGGRIVANGSAVIGPTSLPLQLGGTVQVQNGRPKVVVDDARLSGVQLPQSARSGIESTLQGQVDALLSGQPMRVMSVTIGGGTLTIIGSRA